MGAEREVQDFYSLLRYPGPDALITYSWARRIKKFLDGDDFVFIDAGCGSGRHSAGILDTYLRARGYCLDFSKPSLEEASALFAKKGFSSRATLVNASYLEKIQIPEKVDVALAIGTIHHCPDPLQALKNIAEVVKEGGIVACMVYGIRNHRRRYEIKELVHLLGQGDNVLGLYGSYQDKYEGILDKSLREIASDARNRVGHCVRRMLRRKSHGYLIKNTEDVFRNDAIAVPIDTAFDTQGVRALIEGAGLQVEAMLGLGRFDEGLLPPDWISGWRRLPYWEQVRVMELVDPLPKSWSFICRKP